MKRKIGMAAAAGLVAAATFAGAAMAQCTSPTFISFNGPDAFAFETAYDNATYTSFPGSQLTVFGRVVCFGPPLDYLNANMPGTEYTFVIQGLVSNGTIHTMPLAGVDAYDTDYMVAGATWAVYEDNTPDAPPASTIGSPGSALPLYSDGTPILTGSVDYFHTQITKSSTNRWSGSFNALYHPTGGTLLGLVGTGQANLNGLWCSLGSGTGQCTLPAGYSAHPSGKFDQPSTTPTRGASWGRLRMLYR